jgi:hypothetical protein
MCTKIHYRFRRCSHTRFLRWDYCSVIIPSDRVPATGHACRRYKFRYKDNQEQMNCFECIRERVVAGEMDGYGDGKEKEKEKKDRKWVRVWVRGVVKKLKGI